MPRKPKPLAAMARHMTREEKEARQQAEDSLKLGTENIFPPSWLGEDATFIFRRIVKEGAKINLWDNLDNDALARYADLSAKLIYLHDRVDREGIITTVTDAKGNSHTDISPAYRAYLQCHDAVRKQSAALGITTIERLRLAANGKVEKPKNKFIEVLNLKKTEEA